MTTNVASKHIPAFTRILDGDITSARVSPYFGKPARYGNPGCATCDRETLGWVEVTVEWGDGCGWLEMEQVEAFLKYTKTRGWTIGRLGADDAPRGVTLIAYGVTPESIKQWGKS